MRDIISPLICESASSNPKFLVLSGDHGYGLFNEIRKKFPQQFINSGVLEQAMVGIASGLAKLHFRPVVYGLSAFIPIRVLEQIKLDVCFPNLPVIFLGDGAGLVYSTLGASHQCAEDIACLRPLPNLSIYSPCDEEELRICFKESLNSSSPSYIRIGKSDQKKIHLPHSLINTEPHMTHLGNPSLCIVANGSMTPIAQDIGLKLNISVCSIPRIKPFSSSTISLLKNYKKIIALEEHSIHGGLYSTLAEIFVQNISETVFFPITLQEKFSEFCGTYQYALSEHQLSHQQIFQRVQTIIDNKISQHHHL